MIVKTGAVSATFPVAMMKHPRAHSSEVLSILTGNLWWAELVGIERVTKQKSMAVHAQLSLSIISNP